MSKPKAPSLEELVNDFQSNYGRGRTRTCLACDSPNREVIDVVMRGGAGGPSVSRFLRDRFGENISQSVLGRHKTDHLDV